MCKYVLQKYVFLQRILYAMHVPKKWPYKACHLALKKILFTHVYMKHILYVLGKCKDVSKRQIKTNNLLHLKSETFYQNHLIQDKTHDDVCQSVTKKH